MDHAWGLLTLPRLDGLAHSCGFCWQGGEERVGLHSLGTDPGDVWGYVALSPCAPALHHHASASLGGGPRGIEGVRLLPLHLQDLGSRSGFGRECMLLVKNAHSPDIIRKSGGGFLAWRCRPDGLLLKISMFLRT
jgi:hypothetical protein